MLRFSGKGSVVSCSFQEQSLVPKTMDNILGGQKQQQN